MILSAEAFLIAMGLVKPKISTKKSGKKGTILIGTVAGDMHSLVKIKIEL
ncbi:MAG: hypothetical protein ACTSYC_12695 [Promethearchaeota archaeon]